MSISHAMQAGVSGLKANATAAATVSSNIANANTDGFKRSFAQMVTTATASTVNTPPGGVRALQRSDVSLEGQLRATDAAGDLAVQGQGFFVVSKTADDPAATDYFFTRAGSFRPDAEGNLRNSAGYYLAGFPAGQDGTVGGVDRTTFGGLETVNTGAQTIPGTPTTRISLAGNLPAQESGLATPGDPFVESASAFTPLGETQRLRFSWQPEATDDQWSLTFGHEDGTDYGRVTVDFNSTGPAAGTPSAYTGITSLAAAPAAFAFDPATGEATVTTNDGGDTQTIAVTIGAPDTAEGVTQFAGDYAPFDTRIDGNGSGSLVRTEFGEGGEVFGVFDNGARRTLFEVPLATVPNASGLAQVDGNAYRVTLESGDFDLVTPGMGGSGSITAGALESSTVELAEELTSLIEIQRAYSSNAKIITTADEMLDETVRIKR
jgi:flagellar hook protein FlgE